MLKKYDITIKNLSYKDHYVINNLDEYRQYLSILNNRFAVSEREITDNESLLYHQTSELTELSGVFCGMNGDPEKRANMLEHIKFIYGRVVSSQLNDIIDGKRLVINNRGGNFSIKPGDDVSITEIKSCLYTVDDIIVNKWYGGSHYYAKICYVDVVDEDGNVKWNTEEVAMKEAIKYLHKLNNL